MLVHIANTMPTERRDLSFLPVGRRVAMLQGSDPTALAAPLIARRTGPPDRAGLPGQIGGG